MSYRWFLGIGFFLVLFGMVAPFLMVMRIVESTFFMNFFSFGASVVGLFFGIIGVAYYARTNRK